MSIKTEIRHFDFVSDSVDGIVEQLDGLKKDEFVGNAERLFVIVVAHSPSITFPEPETE